MMRDLLLHPVPSSVPTALSTSTATRIISGPIPSPGSNVILYLLLFFTFVAPDPEDALTTSFRLLLPVVDATKTPGALIIPCHKGEENLQQEEKVVIVGGVVVVVVVVVRLLSARPSCSSTAILLLPLCFLKMLNYMNFLLLRKGEKKRQKLAAKNLKNNLLLLLLLLPPPPAIPHKIVFAFASSLSRRALSLSLSLSQPDQLDVLITNE
jgi:hypothetical protein